MERFIAVFDPHYGQERRGGRLAPLQDQRAIDCVLSFSQQFKPHTVVLGGDILDCGAVSHHNKNKPRQIEGMRLIKDAELAKAALIEPLESTMVTSGRKKKYHKGNHEVWLDDLLDKEPGLEGMLSASDLLGLDDYEIFEQGEVSNLGHLHFIHGDTISGGEHVAKQAVTNYAVSIAFGHFHTHQTFTMTSQIHEELPRQGMAVGCLCHKSPSYGKLRPNRWCQGFLHGVILPNGNFHAQHTNIISGTAVVDGRLYKG